MKADGSSQVNISNNVTADDVATDWQSVSYPGGIYDDFFSPTTEKPTLGGTVLWENYGTDSEGHTVTDNSGMGLFDSLVIPPGGFFQRQFTAASKYPFYCTVHTFMTGTVNVPMTAAPKTGNLTTVFTITWATIAPAVPYRYDVQIKRPGSSDFVDWVTNSTLKAKSFTADAGTGTYSFQARIRNTSNGFAATYSAPATITVNP